MKTREGHEATMENSVMPGIGIGLVAGFLFAGPQYVLNVGPVLAEKIFFATLLVSLAAVVSFVVYLKSDKNLFQSTPVTS